MTYLIIMIEYYLKARNAVSKYVCAALDFLKGYPLATLIAFILLLIF
jgi:hypothetical protein